MGCIYFETVLNDDFGTISNSTGLKYIKAEYKLSKKEIKNINEERDLEVGFNKFKIENHILSIVSKINKMIGWMVRNLFQWSQKLFQIYIKT